MKFYVLKISEEMVPELSSPFNSEDEQCEHAAKMLASSPEGTGILWLDQDGQKIEVGAFDSGFLEDMIEEEDGSDDLDSESAMLANRLP